MIRKLTGILLFGLFTVACRKDPPPPQRCFVANTSDTLTHSIHNHWIFLGFLRPDGEELCTPAELRTMRIDFRDSTRMGVGSCCNSGAGYYEIHNQNEILTDSLYSTMIYCPGTRDVWEGWYFEHLSRVKTYEIDHNLLYLQSADGTRMIFRLDQ